MTQEKLSDVPKFIHECDAVETYGAHLRERIQKEHKNRILFGKTYEVRYWDNTCGAGYCIGEGYKIQRTGLAKLLLGKTKDVFNILVNLDPVEHPEISVHDVGLRDSVNAAVDELNKESGKNYRVGYSNETIGMGDLVTRRGIPE